MKNFWKDLERPFFVLAPMEAVTDVVFRHVVEKAARPDVYFTEFTNATGWAHAGDKAIGGRLVKTDDEQPIVAQLWGSNPEAMAKLSAHCRELGYDGPWGIEVLSEDLRSLPIEQIFDRAYETTMAQLTATGDRRRLDGGDMRAEVPA